MTAHDDAITAVKAILLRDATNMHRTSPVELVDAVEPIIRADERRRMEMAAVIDREVIEDDLRERIAQEIEAVMESHRDCPHPECAQSYRDAARIARGGKSDG